MTTSPDPYRGFRFPAEIIEHAVWLYHCFSLSLREVKTILAARGMGVSYESMRDWSLRVFLQRAWRGADEIGQSWAIEREQHVLEKRFWGPLNVELYKCPLPNYAAALESQLAAYAHSRAPT